MKKTLVCSLTLWSALALSGIAMAQQVPVPTELLGKPFVLKQTWDIGVGTDWDFVKFDPSYLRLYVSHGTKVQVIEVETGAIVGEVNGLYNARDIALDDRGQFGFISDRGTNLVTIFERQSLRVVKRITTAPHPRELVYEPVSGLLFVICGQPFEDRANPSYALPSTEPNMGVLGWAPLSLDDPVVDTEPGSYEPVDTARRARTRHTRNGKLVAVPPRKNSDPGLASESGPVESEITVIDLEKQKSIANIAISGRPGAARSDLQGRLFVALVDRNSVAQIDAPALRSLIGDKPKARKGNPGIPINWTGKTIETLPPEDLYHVFPLDSRCLTPGGLTIDARHLRLFVSCGSSQLLALNSDNGQEEAAVETGPGTGVIEYDGSRGLLFAANGGGGGTLTIIRQHVIDKYEVVQNLMTARRARVMAVNPVSGDVYLVTDGGGPNLYVLVVGN